MKRFLLILILLFISTSQIFAAIDPPNMSLDTSGTSITVSWTEVDEATGYRLYYAPYPYRGEHTIGSIDMGTNTSTFYLLWDNAAYYVAITARDATGESDYSNIELFIMGPPTPEWVDDDSDGFSEIEGDCDDAEALINPDAEEICGDDIDQDCDGVDEICPAPSSPNLPDTGQLTCYDTSGAVINCSGTGQDGAHIINPMSFSDNGNGTVRDNITGLVWQKSNDNLKRNWLGAKDYCANLNLGGSMDWRLPSHRELMGIVDYSEVNPAINPVFEGINPDDCNYWSSTSYFADTNIASSVHFLFGNVNHDRKLHDEYVRCVQ